MDGLPVGSRKKAIKKHHSSKWCSHCLFRLSIQFSAYSF